MPEQQKWLRGVATAGLLTAAFLLPTNGKRVDAVQFADGAFTCLAAAEQPHPHEEHPARPLVRQAANGASGVRA